LKGLKIKLSRIRRKHNSKWTVATWISYWYQTYKEPKHSPTTRQVQWSYINVHIIPKIGHIRLISLHTVDIQNFLNYLLKEGNKSKLKHSTQKGKPLSTWAVKKIRAMLVAALDIAKKEKIIEDNYARETEPITVQTLKIAYFTKQQQRVFLEGTRNHRFNLAYELLFNTGCRRSEILGLSWLNVDFENCVIHIKQALVNINGTPFLKNYPKTNASIRTIPVHPKLMKALQKHKKQQEIEEKNDTSWNNKYDLVFVNKDGTPHSPTYFLHNFKNSVRKLGLPKNLRVHSTRHTFATNLLKIPGVSIADVQYLGGWADTRVILEIYAHTVQKTHRNAITKLYES
jgi:integrase